MKTTLTVTAHGSITLPARLRRQLDIGPGHQLIAEVTSDGLLLRPAASPAVELYDDRRITEFDEAEAELGEFLSRKGSGSD